MAISTQSTRVIGFRIRSRKTLFQAVSAAKRAGRASEIYILLGFCLHFYLNFFKVKVLAVLVGFDKLKNLWNTLAFFVVVYVCFIDLFIPDQILP